MVVAPARNWQFPKSIQLCEKLYSVLLVYISLSDLKQTKNHAIFGEKNISFFKYHRSRSLLGRFWKFWMFWIALIVYVRFLILFCDNNRLLRDNDRRSGITAESGRQYYHTLPWPNSTVWPSKFISLQSVAIPNRRSLAQNSRPLSQKVSKLESTRPGLFRTSKNLKIGPITMENDKNEKRIKIFHQKLKDFHDFPDCLRSDNDMRMDIWDGPSGGVNELKSTQFCAQWSDLLKTWFSGFPRSNHTC